MITRVVSPVLVLSKGSLVANREFVTSREEVEVIWICSIVPFESPDTWRCRFDVREEDCGVQSESPFGTSIARSTCTQSE